MRDDKGQQDGGVVHVLLQKKYLHWLEALSLLRSMSEGVIAVQKLEALAVSYYTFMHILETV